MLDSPWHFASICVGHSCICNYQGNSESMSFLMWCSFFLFSPMASPDSAYNVMEEKFITNAFILLLELLQSSTPELHGTEIEHFMVCVIVSKIHCFFFEVYNGTRCIRPLKMFCSTMRSTNRLSTRQKGPDQTQMQKVIQKFVMRSCIGTMFGDYIFLWPISWNFFLSHKNCLLH